MINSILNSTSNGDKRIYAFDTYPVYARIKTLLLERCIIHNPYDQRLPDVVNQHLTQLKMVVQTICKQVIMDAKEHRYISPLPMILPIIMSLETNGLLLKEIDPQVLAEDMEAAISSEFINVVIGLFEEIGASDHYITNYRIVGSNVICEVAQYPSYARGSS